MSERSAYPPGAPCWVAAAVPDPERGVAFYTQLFGWQSENLIPSDSAARYFVCRLRGRTVAAIVSQDTALQMQRSSWTTLISVADLDDTLSKVGAAGGRVLSAPSDSPAGGARRWSLTRPAPCSACGLRTRRRALSWSMSPKRGR
jgi:predicted enzyme related to lactoylglutathione lyase